MDQILLKVSYYIVLLPLFTGLILWPKTKKLSRWLILLSFIATIPHLLAAAGLPHQKRNIVYNLYTVAEWVVMFAIFKPKFATPFSKKLFKASSFIALIITIPLLLSKNFLYDFNNQLVCLTNLVYLFWILVLMRETYMYDTVIFTKNDPFTYFASGIIVYASASMVVMGLYSYLLENKNSPATKLWIFHDFSNIFIYVMFFVGIVTEARQSKSNTLKHA